MRNRARLGWRTGRAAAGQPKSTRKNTGEVVAKTLQPPPEELGVAHPTSRLMKREVGLDHSTIARIWQDHGLQPWRAETFKYSTDPQLEDKARDIVGVYMDPPENAVVVCVGEKSVDPSVRARPAAAAAAARETGAAHP